MAKKRNTKRNRAAKKSLKQKFEEHPITVIATAIVCFLGVPAAIIGLFMQIKECAVEFLPPEPSIVMNEVGGKYSWPSYYGQPLLIYNNEKIIEVDANEKEYVIGKFSDYLVQNALITNINESNDITLTELKIKANNIKIDYTPVLEVDSCSGGDDAVKINLYNKGWSDISNISISLKDINDFIDFSGYSANVNLLEYGNNTDTSIQLDMGEFSHLTNYGDGDYPIYLELTFNESDDTFVYETECSIHVEGTKVSVCFDGNGTGGPSGICYGICINTDKSSFEFKQSIQEVITAGETLELPIFFFPDKSCEFDYYIEFAVNNAGKKQRIKTDIQHVKYKVDSSMSSSEWDVEKLIELKGWREIVNMVTYPYCKEWTWYDDELYRSNDSFNHQGNVY